MLRINQTRVINIVKL